MSTIIPYTSNWRQTYTPRQSSTSTSPSSNIVKNELDESIAGEIYLVVNEEQDKETLLLRLHGLLRKYKVNENVYLILRSYLSNVNNREFVNITLSTIDNYINQQTKI